MKHILLLLSLTIFYFSCTFAQGFNKDSILQIAQHAPDKEKQQALQLLILYYKNNDPQTALQYVMQQIEVSQRINDEATLAKAYQNAGILSFRVGNFQRAKEFYLQALEKFIQQRNTDAQNEVNSYLGAVYYANGNLPLAAETYLKALRYYEEKNDKAALLNILSSLGSIYSRQNNFSKALEYNLRALRIYEESSDRFRTLVGYDNIGNIYLRQGNLQKAEEFFNKSLKVYRELNNKAGEATTLYQLGTIADKQNDIEQSIAYYGQSIEMAKAIKAQPMQATAELALANNLSKIKLYQQAITSYQNAIRLAKQLEMKIELEEAYRGISQAYAAVKQQQKATTFGELSRELKDSLYNDSNIKKLADLQLVYETEKKQQQIELLSKEQQLQELELKRERESKNFWAYASVALAFIFVVLIYFSIQNKRIANNLRRQKEVLEQKNREVLEQKEQLNQLNNVKDRFFSIISHDLRNNLATMKLYFDLISHPDYKPADHTEATRQISASVENTIDLLENLLVWASAQIKGVPIHIQKLNIHSLIEGNINLVAGNAHQKNISIINASSEHATAMGDIDMIHLVLRNLISNAIKFTNDGGKIQISSKERNGRQIICIQDNGVGISKENLAKLFDQHLHPSTKGTGNEKGTGLGLMLCKDFMERNQGSIRVESEKGKGTSFYIELPIAG